MGIIVTIIIICLIGGIIPVILVRLLSQTKSECNRFFSYWIVYFIYFLSFFFNLASSVTNITASFCSLTTCIGYETPYRTSIITALYPFDSNINDLSGYNIGIPSGLTALDYTPTTAYIRQAIGLTASNNHYIRIPYINLRQQSFTIQLWCFILNSVSVTDYPLFSQCGSDLICLSISIRNNRVIVSFDSLNNNATILTGASLIPVSVWQHITVVYDAIRYQQLIYVNGQTDAVSYGIIQPYQGSSIGANTYIGFSSSVNYSSSYFNGY